MQTSLPGPGACVWIRQRRWVIERARVDRSVLRLDVASGARRLTFLAPFDRPLAAPRRVRPTPVRRQQALARLAHVLAASHSFDLPQAALHAPIDILAYQLEPTLALLSGIRRVLVADDVGLGKTVQAGLALAELRHRRASCSALIIVPAPLVDQWLYELRERLRLEATAVHQEALDREALQGGVGATPWDRPGIWVASPDYLKQRHVLDGIPPTPWDIVIIDEAHGVTGDSGRHEACHELAQRARHVMLLTATPHSGDDARFRRLVDLGRLPREGDELRVFRRTKADVVPRPAPVSRRPRVVLTPQALQVFDALLAFERAVLRAADAGQQASAHLLISVLRKRAASTLHALEQSIGRRLDWLQTPDRAYQFDWLQPPLPFIEEEAHDSEERQALIGETGLSASRERTWLRRLRLLCSLAMPGDPKPRHLSSLFARSTEPVVVFTEYRATLDCLQKRLRGTRTIAILHGGLTPRERQDQLAMFLTGEASVLLATDVGGQGLNLQSKSRWVVNVDVPWNPTRLQQRVGRVDRIGQQRRVHTSTLSLRHIVEDPVLESIARREQRARQVMGGMPGDSAPTRIRENRTGGPTASGAAATLAICHGFQRRARAMARVLRRRRAWSRCWRGPMSTDSRPYRTRRPYPGTTPPVVVVILSVPIVSGTGAIVEQHVRALRVEHPPDRDLNATAMLHVARAILARSMTARVARVGRTVARSTAAGLSIETALANLVHDLTAPEETQLALGSRREHTEFDRARRITAAADAHCAERVAELRQFAQLALGEATIVALFGDLG